MNQIRVWWFTFDGSINMRSISSGNLKIFLNITVEQIIKLLISSLQILLIATLFHQIRKYSECILYALNYNLVTGLSTHSMSALSLKLSSAPKSAICLTNLTFLWRLILIQVAIQTWKMFFFINVFFNYFFHFFYYYWSVKKILKL